MSKTLTREQILGAKDLKTERVAVPEWGGDVIVQDEALYGDGVNIAARLEALAEPGGICISGAAHAEVENKLPLEFEFQGKQQVKNIANAVPVYRVLSLPGGAAARVMRAARLGKWVERRKGKIVGLAMAAILVLGLIAAEAYISRLRQPAVEDDPVLAMGSKHPYRRVGSRRSRARLRANHGGEGEAGDRDSSELNRERCHGALPRLRE